VDHHIYADSQEALMPHRYAPLTETGRLRLARCVVEDGWPLRRAAERFQVSHATAARYRQQGTAGMADRSSRPHTTPARTPVRTEHRIVSLRVSKRLGAARIAFGLGLNPPNRAQGAHPLWLPAAGAPGPGQRAARAPL
jgi:hypothetical protein